MRWLIVEDALRDRKGHWFEYVTTFHDGLRELGDEVEVLADRQAEPFILERLNARAILPASIWHRMSDGSNPAVRYLRVPTHAWKTRNVMNDHLTRHPRADVIFVPTMLVHHVLAWVWLIKRHKPKARVLLFFPNVPIRLNDHGDACWLSTPTTRLLDYLLRSLKPEISSGRVALGVETHPMRRAFEAVTGLPITYFPHPVCLTPATSGIRPLEQELRFGCYGPARHEKGSDLFLQAILIYLERFPKSRVRFVIQWLEDFRSETGELVRMDPRLRSNSRVEVVSSYFKDGEYWDYLRRTDVMLLPYRVSSYALRVSRVVIEALCLGLPIITIHGTTLAEQMAEFGTGVCCRDGVVEDLVAAIHQTELCYEEVRHQAKDRAAAARQHFSANNFRRILAR